MSWDKGFNFRGSSGYVTDGADETYAIGDAYPTTRNSVTFGEEDSFFFNLDRNDGVDRRLAGVLAEFQDAEFRFRVDLPATGDYEIHLAIGDAASAQMCKWQTRDSVTGLDTYNVTTSGAAKFYDASGVERADWANDEVAVTRSFASTIFRLVHTASSSSSVVAHLRLVQLEVDEIVSHARFLPLLGVA